MCVTRQMCPARVRTRHYLLRVERQAPARCHLVRPVELASLTLVKQRMFCCVAVGNRNQCPSVTSPTTRTTCPARAISPMATGEAVEAVRQRHLPGGAAVRSGALRLSWRRIASALGDRALGGKVPGGMKTATRAKPHGSPRRSSNHNKGRSRQFRRCCLVSYLVSREQRHRPYHHPEMALASCCAFRALFCVRPSQEIPPHSLPASIACVPLRLWLSDSESQHTT
mmetsp:Transcript_36714/g.96963  ORF Transcript_36714/g.96963 Transcript_36714/m.96963 type:complete len:226 (+) Transcript_36714:5287-5964(+)